MKVIVFGNNRVAQRIYEWLKLQQEDVCGLMEGKDHVRTPCDWEEPFRGDLCGTPNEWIGEWPDLIVCARGAAILIPETLALPTIGTVNIHYGKLPEYRGCHPIVHAILNGDKEIVVTIHWMTAGIDEGAIITERRIDATGKTAFELYQEANVAAVMAFQSAWPIIKYRGKWGIADGIPQTGAARYYRKNSIDFARNSIIRPSMGEEEQDRRRRAFTFPPYQIPRYESDEPLGGVVNWQVSDPLEVFE